MRRGTGAAASREGLGEPAPHRMAHDFEILCQRNKGWQTRSDDGGRTFDMRPERCRIGNIGDSLGILRDED